MAQQIGPDACSMYLTAQASFGAPLIIPPDFVTGEPAGFVCYGNNLTSEVALFLTFDDGQTIGVTNSDAFIERILRELETGLSLENQGHGFYVADAHRPASLGAASMTVAEFVKTIDEAVLSR